MIRHNPRCVVIALPREIAGRGFIAEPDARFACRSDRRGDPCFVHCIYRFFRGPLLKSTLAGFSGRYFSDKGRRRYVVMSIDPVRPGRQGGLPLGRESSFRNERCRAKCSHPDKKVPPWGARRARPAGFTLDHLVVFHDGLLELGTPQSCGARTLRFALGSGQGCRTSLASAPSGTIRGNPGPCSCAGWNGWERFLDTEDQRFLECPAFAADGVPCLESH